MSLLVVLLVVALAVALFAIAPRRRSQIEQLLEEVERTDNEEELAEAEDEVRSLDVMATPEDAVLELPDWGPGVPRKKKRS